MIDSANDVVRHVNRNRRMDSRDITVRRRCFSCGSLAAAERPLNSRSGSVQQARIMAMNMLLPIHIAAGGWPLFSALALFVKKGGTIHRRSGLLFVYAMLVMGITASILAFLKSPADENLVAGAPDRLLCRHGADDRPPVVAMDPP